MTLRTLRGASALAVFAFRHLRLATFRIQKSIASVTIAGDALHNEDRVLNDVILSVKPGIALITEDASSRFHLLDNS